MHLPNPCSRCMRINTCCCCLLNACIIHVDLHQCANQMLWLGTNGHCIIFSYLIPNICTHFKGNSNVPATICPKSTFWKVSHQTKYLPTYIHESYCQYHVGSLNLAGSRRFSHVIRNDAASASPNKNSMLACFELCHFEMTKFEKAVIMIYFLWSR